MATTGLAQRLRAGDVVRLACDDEPEPTLFKVRKLLPAREWWKGEVGEAVSCRGVGAKRGGYTFRRGDVVKVAEEGR